VLIESVRQHASYFGLPISEFVAIIGNCNFNRCHGWRPSKTRLVQSQTIAAITRRSNTPLRGWIVCKSRLCGFAAQKYSTTHDLQTAVVLNVKYLSLFWFVVVVNAVVLFVSVFTLRESCTWKNRSCFLLRIKFCAPNEIVIRSQKVRRSTSARY